MAKRKPAGRDAAEAAGSGESAHRAGLIENLVRAALTQGTTGRFLVVYQPGEAKAMAKTLKDVAGLETISSADFSEGFVPHEAVNGEVVMLANLDVGITSADPDQLQRVSLSAADSPVQFVVPETAVFLSVDPVLPPPGMPLFAMPAYPVAGGWPPGAGYPGMPGGLSLEYLLGYRDAISRLIESLGGGMPSLPYPQFPVAVPAVPGLPPSTFAAPSAVTREQLPMPQAELAAGGFDEGEATWGLQACNVLGSQFTGKDVKVAILDTGLDLTHPDFQDGRVVMTKSFVGQPVQDVPSAQNPGHGTHCTGIACGPKEPSSGPRYGVACDALIHVGKVFLNNGSTTTGAITEAISWAIAQKCRIVSMSLGAPPNGPNPDPLYEALGKRAVQQGTAIIAAAGNRSKRSFNIFKPVDSPANATKILGVGAVDRSMRIADFSNRGLYPPGGDVNIVGPGVNIYSSLPLPKKYGNLSGTSMATPCAAGIAALIAEAEPGWEAWRIMNFLCNTAHSLQIDARDVGQGLVQAP
jgi:subtilisin family serine protease